MTTHLFRGCIVCIWSVYMNRIYRVIWNCTLQVFQACSELTRRAGKTSTVNLRKSSGLTTKFSRLTLGVLLALSGSASGASLEVDNDQARVN
ncbi:TPA: ESPR-type extended signal peptide-containing protein [Escherichia coli]